MQGIFEREWKLSKPEMEGRLRRRWCRPPVNPEPLQMLLCPPPLELWTQTHLAQFLHYSELLIVKGINISIHTCSCRAVQSLLDAGCYRGGPQSDLQ